MGEPAAFVARLEGRRLDALVVQEFHHHGRLADAANVVHLQTDDGAWTRCFWDAAAFRWDAAAPAPVAGGEPAYAYALVDRAAALGVAGRRIVRVRFTQPAPHAARLTITLDAGVIVLDHAHDRSRLAVVGG